MRNTEDIGIRATLARREDLLQLVASAALLGLGVNLLSSVLATRFESHFYAVAAAGFSLIALSFVYISRVVMKVRRIRRNFNGVLVYDRRKMRIAPAPGYRLSQRLARTLKAGFAENAALKVAWEAEPLRPARTEPRTDGSSAPTGQSRDGGYVAITKVIASSGHAKRINSRSAVVLREAMEYSVLEELSTHLSTYFNDYDDEDNYIREYTRKDVPELLLQNRFLALLSTPLEDRAIFVNSPLAKVPLDGEVHMLVGPEGELFQRFDLVLPIDTTIERPETGCLNFTTPRLSLSLRVRYDGFSATTPTFFEEGLLGVADDDVEALQVIVEVDAEIKMTSLLRFGGWRYYEWLDSFIARLHEFASFDSYIDRIAWQSALTTAHLLRRSDRSKADRNRPATAGSQGAATPELPAGGEDQVRDARADGTTQVRSQTPQG